MSVARAEAELATILLIELIVADAEEEDSQDDGPGACVPRIATVQPAPAA